MVSEDLNPSTSTPFVNYPQVLSGAYLRGSFVGDDTDNHDFLADGRGKGRLAVCFHTTGTSTYTVSVYGMHSSTSVVGDFDSFFIGQYTATSSGHSSTNGGYETVADPFPFYLARVQKGDTGETSDPTNHVFINFSAF